MRPSHGFGLAFVLICAACSVSRAAAQDAVIKITGPKEGERYGPGANMHVIGHLQLPDKQNADLLFLRFRVYRPENRSFIIDQEAMSRIKAELRGRVPFDTPLKLPNEDGVYLLRVDCLNLNVDPANEGIIASQSMFIRVVRNRP
jgi:hypothetical protein